MSASIKNEKGAAAVEFAMVVIILVGIVAAVFEFGSAFTKIQVMTGAAREGARYAAVRKTVSQIKTRVNDAAEPFPAPTPIIKAGTTTYSSSTSKPCQDNTGDSVTVSWNQPLKISVIGLPLLTPSVDIIGTFRCE